MSSQKPLTRNREKSSGKIFVVSGPSGSGKTTLVAGLVKSKDLKNRLIKSVSFTTRSRRPGERNGRDYFFISRTQFGHKRNQQKILEWTKYLGYYYATPRIFVEDSLGRGKSIILCLDLRGASRIKKFYPQRTVTIFIAPPSLGTLRDRIQGRCRTARTELKERLKLADREVGASGGYDYIIVNKNFSQALKKLHSIAAKEMGIKAR